jgi:hypothetical protein
MMPETLTYLCPFCDREVRVGEPCPGCAAKRKTPAPTKPKAWKQDSAHDALDLPDDDFDYDEFVAREFGGGPHRKIGVKWYWWLLGVALLALMLVSALRGF